MLCVVRLLCRAHFPFVSLDRSLLGVQVVSKWNSTRPKTKSLSRSQSVEWCLDPTAMLLVGSKYMVRVVEWTIEGGKESEGRGVRNVATRNSRNRKKKTSLFAFLYPRPEIPQFNPAQRELQQAKC